MGKNEQTFPKYPKRQRRCQKDWCYEFQALSGFKDSSRQNHGAHWMQRTYIGKYLSFGFYNRQTEQQQERKGSKWVEKFKQSCQHVSSNTITAYSNIS